MKHNLLPLFGMAFVAASANAQSWTAPIPALQDGPKSYAKQMIYNVEANQFLTGGFYWGYEPVLSDKASAFFMTDSISATNGAGWTIQIQDSTVLHRDGNVRWNTYMFRATDSRDRVYLDMGGTLLPRFWSIEKQTNGHYRLRIESTDPTYGEAVNENYNLEWFGQRSDMPDYVAATADPTNADYTSQVDWAFVDINEYEAWLAKKSLFNALVAAEESGYDIDLAPYSTLYEGGTATDEELKAAAKELNDKVRLAQVYEVLDGASADNPKDATSLLVNPNFDGGQDGWTNTFVQGTSATNIAWQNRTDTNEEDGVSISDFAEAWTNQPYGAAAQSLGVGKIYQVMESLPAGKYELELDATATSQIGLAVKGVHLYATGGDLDNYSEVGTKGGVPEHFKLTFISAGGDVELGFRTTEECTANWIAIDNFKLTYFGEVGDPYQEALNTLVAELEAQYPYVSELLAQQSILDAYEAALEEAKNATDDFQNVAENLRQASINLKNGIAEYVDGYAQIQTIKDAADEASAKGWNELTDDLNMYYEELDAKYEAKELTTEDVAEIASKKNELIGAYISENAKEGDDVSLLLQNNSFDTNFSGWDVADGGATPAWGGADLVNNVEGGIQPAEIGSGNAEVYQAAFDMSQTIKNMPVGLYTLSCKAFERTDGAIQAELYAVVDGEEQTQKIMSLFDEAGSPTALFDNGAWQTDLNTDARSNGNYVPNSMCGANVWFNAEKEGSEDGYYANKFNILVKEAGDIKVGIRTQGTGGWVIFDDFKLVYQGNSVAAYVDIIQDLANQAQSIVDGEDLITQEAEDKLNKAITAGEDALGGTSTDDCVAAMKDLEAAIAFADETADKVEALQAFYHDVNENFMNTVESSDEALPELLGELEAYVGDGADQKFATNDEVDEAYADLEEACVKYVQYDAIDLATADDPADISDAIFTREGTDAAGEASTAHWTIDGNVGLGSGIVEIYNQTTPSFKQTVRGLAPGWYKLGVQGFYRGQGNTPSIPVGEVEADTCKNYVNIVAGEAHTKLASLKSGAEAFNALEPNADETLLTTPNTMAQAATAFENDLYHNYLLFEVKEGEEEVVIGFEKEGGVAADWLVWDNWTLEYYGTEKPAVDPTTAVDGIEEANTQRVEIYSVGGTKTGRLLKGVNIIKTIKADGSVETRKVLVR